MKDKREITKITDTEQRIRRKIHVKGCGRFSRITPQNNAKKEDKVFYH